MLNALSERRAAAGEPGVVCVDLDGSLITTDVLWESLVSLVKVRPIRAIRLVFALFAGRAHFKQCVARATQFDAAKLPYRTELVDYLRDLQRRGAYLVLATGSDYAQATAVAEHLGIFADVIASDGATNLTGRRKATVLVERFGDGGFHYIGNDWSDIPVWRAAGEGTVVGASPRLARYLTGRGLVGRMLEGRRDWLKLLGRAMRPHQWAKNVLVFVPAIAAHSIVGFDTLRTSALTFVAFSLCASAIYIVNDVSDIQTDRLHPRKRTRPFAAGELGIPVGCMAAASLLSLSIVLAALGVSWQLAAALVAYVSVTTAYSLKLKQMPVVDVFTLTGLYVLRIIAGGIATSTPLSSWLLAFGLFFFLSLAFVKRYSELLTVQGWMPGRGYCPEDALWMHAVGTSAGYMAVLVLALYISSPEVARLYATPQALWLLCPLLLFWLTRLWFRTGRRLIHDDPIYEALKDPFSYLCLAVASVVMFIAL